MLNSELIELNLQYKISLRRGERIDESFLCFFLFIYFLIRSGIDDLYHVKFHHVIKSSNSKYANSMMID